MSNYVMSCFKIPFGLCKEINPLLAKFWWGQREDKNKVHWVSWDKFVDKNSKGGLGFQDLECFNLAMLAKQGWRIITNSDSLLGKILKGRYFCNSNFFNAKVGRNPSWAWRSILEGWKILMAGLRWRIGNGRSVQVWSDPWIPKPHSNLFSDLLNAIGIGNARNDKLFNGKAWSPLEAVEKIKADVSEWAAPTGHNEENEEVYNISETGEGRTRNWQPPPGRKFKMNIDGAWCSKDKNGGVGVVVRDELGQFIARMARRVPHLASAKMVEAAAFQEGAQFCKELGIKGVVVESDSKGLVDGILKEKAATE